MKKFLAAICASAMILAACTACSVGSGTQSSESAPPETTAVPETTAAPETTAPPEAEPIVFEDPVVAAPGDAILAIADGQWYVQYWGTADDLLTYDAGIASIKSDGDYTVSVNVRTKGAQYDIGGDPDGTYKCEGLEFACVKVLEGSTKFPDMSIEIKEIRVDGKAVELKAKNYTSSDDGTEMRANIYNYYVSTIPEDAHNAFGAISPDTTEYSAQIIDPADFAKWSKIEVDFTVTGTGTEAAETTAPAEENTAG